MAEEVMTGSEGAVAEGGSVTRIFGFIALAIYFIWGQGFACAWWMWIIFGGLAFFVLTNKAQVLQWILGLFLIGITFFASPTFGYSEIAKSQYKQGMSDAYPVTIGYSYSPEEAWEDHKDKATVDIDSYKKYYIRGFKRGADGKEE